MKMRRFLDSSNNNQQNSSAIYHVYYSSVVSSEILKMTDLTAEDLQMVYEKIFKIG